MTQGELIPHLFRSEFRKITAVLSKLFGIAHIETAEDIASETFVAALETWTYHGIPENPTAWLYTVAKNKAINLVKRERLFSEKIYPVLQHRAEKAEDPDIDLSYQNIQDSQLQMLFAVCHPSISTEAQIGLALRILCGFGIDEIAHAFVSNKETINKRLFRAKEKLRQEKVAIEIPSDTEIEQRFDAVLTTIYLLFNEGYYSETQNTILREEFCAEAMRLCVLLMENDKTNRPALQAMFALMCFHASRFPARKNNSGELVLYEDQDETLWNRELIAEGAYYLHQASQGTQLSKYHLEAGIAYWHTIKADTEEKWGNILQLYNRLLQMTYSPVVELNRIYAISKVKGKAVAIEEAGNLLLTDNPYYYTLLGELFRETDQAKAIQHLEKAVSIAKTNTDKETILKKITQIQNTNLQK